MQLLTSEGVNGLSKKTRLPSDLHITFLLLRFQLIMDKLAIKIYHDSIFIFIFHSRINMRAKRQVSTAYEEGMHLLGQLFLSLASFNFDIIYLPDNNNRVLFSREINVWIIQFIKFYWGSTVGSSTQTLIKLTELKLPFVKVNIIWDASNSTCPKTVFQHGKSLSYTQQLLPSENKVVTSLYTELNYRIEQNEDKVSSCLRDGNVFK